MDKDAYQIGFSWNEDIMEITITGHTSIHNAPEIAQDVINMMSEHRPDKVLIDSTKIVGRTSLVDTYFSARQYPIHRHRPAKLAVIDIPENRDYFEFHETTAANAGVPIKYFTDIDEAVKWLQR